MEGYESIGWAMHARIEKLRAQLVFILSLLIGSGSGF
jgi:hypothetical protein